MVDFAYFLLGALPILIFIAVLTLVEAITDKKYTALISSVTIIVLMVIFILIVL